jgi:hypothetical protein
MCGPTKSVAFPAMERNGSSSHRAWAAGITATAVLLSAVAWGGARASALAAPFTAGSSTAVSTPPPGKKVIEMGCLDCGVQTHNPGVLRRRLSAVAASPFSGVVVRPTAGSSVFTDKAYPESSFTQDRQDLAVVASSRLTDNFLLMQMTPQSKFDWFDDVRWATVERNVRNFAGLAKSGHFKGIALDSEDYTAGFPLFGYSTQTRKNVKTFRDYQAQVRKRGREFVQAIQTEYPGSDIFALGLTSWLTVAIPRIDDPQEEAYLSGDDGGLSFYFTHGMLDGLAPGTVLTDGDEESYYFRRARAFDDSREFIRHTGRDATILDPANRATYDAQVAIGQAVYVDGLLNLGNWDRTIGYYLASDQERRAVFESNLFNALRTSDEYVWIYSEQMNWWSGDVPTGLSESVRRVLDDGNRGVAPAVDTDPMIDAAYRRPGALTTLLGPEWATT